MNAFLQNNGYGDMTSEQRRQIMQSQGNRQNRQGGSFVTGEIIAKDDKSITIKLTSGGSKIVLLSNTTQIGQFTAATINDLLVGKTVMVSGSVNNDGSVTAQMVQLRSEEEFVPDVRTIQPGDKNEPQQVPLQDQQ